MKAALFLAVTAEAARESPFMKVINLLQDLKATIKDEFNAEQTNWVARKQWCESTSEELATDIEEGIAEVDKFNGEIDAAKSRIMKWEKIVEDNSVQVFKLVGDLSASESQRSDANAAFTTKKAELTEILSQVGQVLKKLTGQSDTVAAELLQETHNLLTRASSHSRTARQGLMLLQDDPEDAKPKQGKEFAYTVRSGGIIKILGELQGEFSLELKAAEQKELDEKNTYEVEKLTMEGEKAAGEEMITVGNGKKAGAEEEKGTATQSLQQSTNALTADRDLKRETEKSCMSEAQNYNAAEKSRAEEMSAIEKAVEVLSDGATETASGHLESSETSFVQIRNSVLLSKNQRDVAKFLKEKALKLDSKILMQLAQLAAEDPLGKVKDMIKGLIAKMAEQMEAAGDRQYLCGDQLEKNQKELDSAENKAAEALADKEMTAANLDVCKSTLVELRDMLEQLNTAVISGEMTRIENSKANLKAIQESQEGAAAVEKAVVVLEEVFSDATAKSFVQESVQGDGDAAQSSTQPGTAAISGEHNDQGSMVIDKLNELGEAMRTHAIGKEQEEKDAVSLWRDTKDQIEKTLGLKKVELTSEKRKEAQLTNDLAQAKDDLKLANSNFKSIKDYREKSLVPQCNAATEGYGKKRQEEMNSLQEALHILSQEAA